MTSMVVMDEHGEGNDGEADHDVDNVNDVHDDCGRNSKGSNRELIGNLCTLAGG